MIFNLGYHIFNDFSHILTKARNQNSEIKIYISIGGGSLSEFTILLSSINKNSKNDLFISIDFIIIIVS